MEMDISGKWRQDSKQFLRSFHNYSLYKNENCQKELQGPQIKLDYIFFLDVMLVLFFSSCVKIFQCVRIAWYTYHIFCDSILLKKKNAHQFYSHQGILQVQLNAPQLLKHLRCNYECLPISCLPFSLIFGKIFFVLLQYCYWYYDQNVNNSIY